MSNDDTGKLSIDNAIMDYLSKKVVTDQTEKLALARISSKMEISSQQVEMSINRLSTKNLIRKVYLQGRIGFEITPRGKKAIEDIAKAETARITRQLQEAIDQKQKQLQEAIQQERKVKLRLSTFEKMKSIEDQWQTYQIPDRTRINEIEQEVKKILAATKEIKEKQPFCHVIPQNYDLEFLQYKSQIEKIAEQNSNIAYAVNDYTKIKSSLLSISADIKNTNKAINKYESVAEAATQISQLKTSFYKLKLIQSQLENFDKNQISRFEDLKVLLQENSRLFEILKKPTHEFTPIKRENLEKTVRNLDPEGPINDGYKTSGYTLLEKCSKCGAKRKSSNVDIG